MVDSLPSVLFLIVAPLVPSFLWLMFFLRGDMHPEPKRLILAAFNVGALVSIPVLALQIIFQKLITDGNGDTNNLILIGGLALIEEVCKFGAVFWLMRRNNALDEPVDAMIYLIAAALGFATVENFFITLNILNSLSVLQFSSATQTLAFRFAGATLLHTLSSAIVGYAWAKEKFLHSPRKIVAGGLCIAAIVHGVFNYLILRFEDTNLLYPSAFLLITAFFVMNNFEKLESVEEESNQNNKEGL